MDSVIQLSAQMNWPFALAAIGLAVAVSVPTITAIASANARRRAELEADKAVELRKIDVSLKNGALPARIED